MTKTREIKVLQQNCGYGWDDIITYEKENGQYNSKEIRDDIKAYRDNGCCVRLIVRRIPNA